MAYTDSMGTMTPAVLPPPPQQNLTQYTPVGAPAPQQTLQPGFGGTREMPVGGYNQQPMQPQPMPGQRQMPPGLSGNWGGGRPQMPTPSMMGGWGRPAMPPPQQPTTGNWQQQLAGLQNQLQGQRMPTPSSMGMTTGNPSPWAGGYDVGQGRPMGGTPWAAPQGPQQPNGGMPMLQPDPASTRYGTGQPMPMPQPEQAMNRSMGGGWAQTQGPNNMPPQFGNMAGNMGMGQSMGQYTPPQNMGGQGKGGQGQQQRGSGKGGQQQQQRRSMGMGKGG